MFWKRTFFCLLLGLLASCSTSTPGNKEPEAPVNKLEGPALQPAVPPVPGETLPQDPNALTLPSGMRLTNPLNNKLPESQDMQAVAPVNPENRATITSSPPPANIPPAEKKKDEAAKPQE
jgi:hypothetical protein